MVGQDAGFTFYDGFTMWIELEIQTDYYSIQFFICSSTVTFRRGCTFFFPSKYKDNRDRSSKGFKKQI